VFSLQFMPDIYSPTKKQKTTTTKKKEKEKENCPD
jgi:hypothetical protein